MRKFNEIIESEFKHGSVDIKNIEYDSKRQKLDVLWIANEIVGLEKFNSVKVNIKKDLPFLKIVNFDYDFHGDLTSDDIIKQWNTIVEYFKPVNNLLYMNLKEKEVECDKDFKITVHMNDRNVTEMLMYKNLDNIFEKHFNDMFNKKAKIEFINDQVNSIDFNTVREAKVEEKVTPINQYVKSAAKEGKSNSSSSKKHKKGKEDVVYGRTIKDSPMTIEEIGREGDRVTIRGKVFDIDTRELRGGKLLMVLSVTDYTDSYCVKLFIRKKQIADVTSAVKKGVFYLFEGDVRYDTYSKEMILMAQSINKTYQEVIRKDNSDVKRVELHMHTNMSEMDAVTSVKDLISRAKYWEHDSIAVTDHGILQSFPDAMDAADGEIKVIYGVEGYLVDDTRKLIEDADDYNLGNEFIVFDIETTGLSKKYDSIIEIGAIKVNDYRIVDKFSVLVNPNEKISPFITELTGITNAMVENAETIDKVMPEFMNFIGDAPLVAHNSPFDVAFIQRDCERIGIEYNARSIDTIDLSKLLITDLSRYRLKTVTRYFKIKINNHHRAIDDAFATAKVFLRLIEMLKENGVNTLKEINLYADEHMSFEKLNTNHIILLAKNYKGLKNLYKLVSMSHIESFYKKPRLLKSEISKLREGLIIGSACEAGEVYNAILNRASDEKVEEIAKFYDYLEIQPLGNNQFLLDKGILKSKEDLIEINKKIIETGKKLNKLTVATCDVHFMDPRDEVYRRILMKGQGFRDADKQPPLYFRTTDEMLTEFSYLDEQLAREVVIDNTRKIADEIDHIQPVPSGSFPPFIEGSEEELEQMCYDKAKRIYGDPIPELVENRLKVELSSIIDNGYAVMYIIAQKLVKKSMEDGYLVGSRGSVGSSFAATMSDITEVNPLPPHYICQECKTSEFYTDGKYSAGVDLPDKKCPNCGADFVKEGHDIPFEVFLGFGGGKEPDIDLNFAGVYQAKAHEYTEELFGEGYTFKAGTIGTIADRTAYGFVKKYFEECELDEQPNEREILRLCKGCTGVKRTSGQHPGGIMVVPNDKEIYDFCPIQYPANDKTSGVITTHFDYHSISGRLLKLDILGHDTPTIIKRLESMTGVNAQEIPLDEPETLKLFTSTESLNIQDPNYNETIGSLGVPEFGTGFVMQMLKDTKPTRFSELVRISGLSHGTDVWLNNAQDLVRDGVVEIKDVISTRDDIMNYLIQNGLPNKESFKIMEDVRKGKGLKDEYLKLMKENDIPDWYITSCETIKYMFPKAHAVAYVMMSFRIAYFKVYHPLAFYATYFDNKVADFDAHLICKGADAIDEAIYNLKNSDSKLKQKDKNTLTVLEVAREVYARGFSFANVDLYKSHSEQFKILKEEQKLLPPLQGLQGLGESVAIRIVEEREKNEFISKDDIKTRAGASKTVIEVLTEHRCIDDLPDENQLSFF